MVLVILANLEIFFDEGGNARLRLVGDSDGGPILPFIG